MPQIFNAFNSMIRAATDNNEFKRALRQISDELDVKTPASQNLLAAYIMLQQTSPDFISKGKRLQKQQKRVRKAKSKTQPQVLDLSHGGRTIADMREYPYLSSDLEDLLTSAKGYATDASGEITQWKAKAAANDRL